MVYRAWIGRRDHTHFTKKKKFVLVDCQPLFGQFGGRKEQLERMRNARATERKKSFPSPLQLIDYSTGHFVRSQKISVNNVICYFCILPKVISFT